MRYFSSDWHVRHRSVLSHCNRPFKSIGIMENYIIDNMNRYIGKKDELYILGDFILTSKVEVVIEVRKKIKCNNVFLVPGNHDMHYLSKPKKEDLSKYINITDNIHTIKEDGNIIVLSHYALESWPQKHYGSYHLHGHSHNGISSPFMRRFDVGVDTNWGSFYGSRLAYTLNDFLEKE